jgi:hypothetical protein
LHPEKKRIVDLREGREGFDFLGCHFHARVSGRLLERGIRRYYLHRWPSQRAMKRIRARVKQITDRRRNAGMKDIREVIAVLNPVLRGWGNYFRTGNATNKFVEIDRHVAWRLKRLMISRKGRNLHAGQADQWTRQWFVGLGLHQLMGTIRYPGDRVSHAKKIIDKPCAGRSSRQGCGPAGESPAMLIVRVEHVATPHPGPGNRPGDAWCERPGGPARKRRGRSSLEAERVQEPEGDRMTAATKYGSPRKLPCGDSSARRTRLPWGEAGVLGEEADKRSRGARRGMGPSTCTRVAEIMSGRAIAQQGLVTTCKDRAHKAQAEAPGGAGLIRALQRASIAGPLPAAVEAVATKSAATTVERQAGW